MSRRTGEDIRVVHDGDPNDGSLLCLADVPQGALAWLMEPDDEAMVDAAAASCAQAIGNLDGADPVGLHGLRLRRPQGHARRARGTPGTRRGGRRRR